MGIDERKFRILQAIIDDYILTAIPVGSRTISKKYETSLSSATIRNEMSDLEELGYLDQPHVSAGRVPSPKAYRLYVDQLLQQGRILAANHENIRAHFQDRARQMEDVIGHAAQVLSSLTHYTALVMSPKGGEMRSAMCSWCLSAAPAPWWSSSPIAASCGRGDPVGAKWTGTPCTPSAGCSRSGLAATPSRKPGRFLPGSRRRPPAGGGCSEISISSARWRSRTPGSWRWGSSNILNFPEYSDVEKARAFGGAGGGKLLQLLDKTGDGLPCASGRKRAFRSFRIALVTASYRLGTRPRAPWESSAPPGCSGHVLGICGPWENSFPALEQDKE